MSNIVLYPGTFDPFTSGHVDLIKRASKMFGQIVIGVAKNTGKKPLFSLDERIELCQQVITAEKIQNCRVQGFSGLLVDFAKEIHAEALLRGIRAVSDFEYECQLAHMNRRLNPLVESVFLMPSEEFAFISSTLVREIAALKGQVNQFVHPIIELALKEKYRSQQQQS